MTEKLLCSARISDRSGWHWWPCSRKATMTVNEKPYCTQHGRRRQEQEDRIAAHNKRMAES